MDVLYRLRGQGPAPFPFGSEAVVKSLDGVGVQCLQLHRTQGGLDV